MPLTRISLRRGKPAAYRQALAEQVYLAMRDSFAVPEDDLFVMIHEHDEADFVFGRTYMDIARSDDLVIIQITANNTRDAPTKQALYRRIVERLGAQPGVRAEDVFINLVETVKENWSFGHGLAQYA